MIVTCPSCRNKYSVQAEAIGNGKLVRCVICGTTWQQLPIHEQRYSKERIIDFAKWTFFWAVVFVSMFMLFFAKNAVVRMWPPAASFYSIFGDNIASQTNALEMHDVSNFFVQKDGKLFIGFKGALINISNEVQILPSITFSLQNDPSKKGLRSFKKTWTHDMQYKKILPNQKVFFETELQEVPCNDLVCDIKLDIL